MKISDRATPFFKTTPVFYQPLTFMEKTEPPYPFWENSKTQTPLYRRGGSNCEIYLFVSQKFSKVIVSVVAKVASNLISLLILTSNSKYLL